MELLTKCRGSKIFKNPKTWLLSFCYFSVFLEDANFSSVLLLCISLSKTYYLIDVLVIPVVILDQSERDLQLLVMLLKVVECNAEKEKEEKSKS